MQTWFSYLALVKRRWVGVNWPCLWTISKNRLLLTAFTRHHDSRWWCQCEISTSAAKESNEKPQSVITTYWMNAPHCVTHTSGALKIYLVILFSADIFQCHTVLKIFSTALSPPPSLVVLLRYRHYSHQGPPSPSMDNAATELSFSVLPIAGEREQEREWEKG